MKEQEQLQPIIITGLSLQDFKDMLQDSVQIAVNNYFNGNNTQTNKQDDELLTAEEVMRLLHISVPTLIRRDKEQVLHPHYTGRKKLYSKKEVMNFLNNK
jgi:hypothetical protein